MDAVGSARLQAMISWTVSIRSACFRLDNRGMGISETFGREKLIPLSMPRLPKHSVTKNRSNAQIQDAEDRQG